MIQLTSENSQLAKIGKVFVKASASWCGPCKMLAPTIDQLEKENPNWQFFHLDIDAERQIFEEFKSKGVPTCVIIINGKIMDVTTGAKGKDTYQQLIDKY